KFGTVVPTLRYDSDLLSGWGKREYNWQTSVAVQHELMPGVALNVGYYRTWFGNFTVAQNAAVSAGDFSSYCVSAPSDARLPNGGGNQICSNFDINPAKFGQVDSLITFADKFGSQQEYFNGVDIGMVARFKKGQLSGGVATGQLVTDNCF